jgi:hypothetical protein
MKFFIVLLFSISSLTAFSQEVSTEEQVYGISELDSKPEYQGEQTIYKFVSSVYKVPDEAKNLNGKVFVGYIIEKDGTLSNFIIKRDIGFGTGEEAIRVLKLSGKWKPGIKGGTSVRSSYTLPITISSK